MLKLDFGRVLISVRFYIRFFQAHRCSLLWLDEKDSAGRDIASAEWTRWLFAPPELEKAFSAETVAAFYDDCLPMFIPVVSFSADFAGKLDGLGT